MPRGKKAGPPIMPFDAPSVEEQRQGVIEEFPDAPSPANLTQDNEPRRGRPREERGGSRLSLQLDDAGRIAWDRMRDSNKAEVEKAIKGWLNDPALAARLGLEKPIIEIFPAAWCTSIYDAAAQIEIALAPKMLGVSHAVAVAAFSFSPEEKSMLAKPTADVVNKWAPLWLSKFKEEIGLAMILIPLTAAKFQLAKLLSEQERAGKLPGMRANGAEHAVTEMPQPS